MSRADEIEARMLSGEPFTYGGMCSRFFRGEHDHDPGRIIDRTIQRLRRKGLIEWRRVGGKVTWRRTGAPQ